MVAETKERKRQNGHECPCSALVRRVMGKMIENDHPRNDEYLEGNI